jgi:uncharacterized delta-60 repeat protein
MTAPRAALAGVLLALAAPAPAGAAVAPGHVTFPLDPRPTVQSVDVFAPALGAARPDGGVVLAGVDRSGVSGLTLTALRRDGSRDPAFGVRGIAHVAVRTDPALIGPIPEQVLRRPDGRLLVVFDGPASSKYELGHLRIAGLTADGHLDPAFGTAGIADPGLQQGCAGCTAAALAPDGSLVLAGGTGSVSPAIEHDPNAPNTFAWAVARLTPAGALDSAFGQGGIATVAGPGSAHGGSVALFADGSIATTGYRGTEALLARLTPSGAPDPLFGGGAPVAAGSGADVLARPDGSADVVVTSPSGAHVARYSRTGAAAGTFGTDDQATPDAGPTTATLLAAPGGAEVLAFAASARITFTAIALDGTVSRPAPIDPGFGGGLASLFARHRAVTVTPLAQTGYRPGRAIMRGDGSVVVPGGVGVIQYTGEGAGYLHEEEAALGLTPALALDPAFGGPATPARIGLEVPAQRAASDAATKLLRVAVDATTSGPGLAVLRVTAGGRVVATSTAPVLRTGHQRLRALLTVAARRSLRHAHRVRVTVTATFRDLVGRQATARARGVLR